MNKSSFLSARPVAQSAWNWDPEIVQLSAEAELEDDRVDSGVGLVVVMSALHVPLALVIEHYPVVGKLHCAAVLLLGLYWAANGNTLRTVQACAYIAGMEVLWRMTGSQLSWEIAKYATSLILVVAILIRGTKLSLLPLAYFALLTLSIPLTALALPVDRARQVISADLSGPFALMIAVCFLARVSFSRADFVRCCLIALVPLSGILTLSWYSILTASELKFHTDSNFVTSGGFGPNQVSAVLGLGALLAFLVLQSGIRNQLLRLCLIIVIPVLIAQSMLTFSRTGVYLAVGSAIVAASLMMRQREQRVGLLLGGGLAFVIVWFILLPRLDTFTGGNLSTRFADTDTSGRKELFWQEVEMWKSHPIVGIGPGMSGSFHRDFQTRSHTEFSRALAEHGILGVISLGLLLMIARQCLIRSGDDWHRATVAALVVWVLLFMCVSGMRLVAPAFLLGMAMVRIEDDDDLEWELE